MLDLYNYQTVEKNSETPFLQAPMQGTIQGSNIRPIPLNLKKEVKKSDDLLQFRVFTAIIADSRLKTDYVTSLSKAVSSKDQKAFKLCLILKKECDQLRKAMASEKDKLADEIAYMLIDVQENLSSKELSISKDHLKEMILSIANGEIYQNLEFLHTYRTAIKENPALNSVCLDKTRWCAEKALKEVKKLANKEANSNLDINTLQTHQRLIELRKALDFGTDLHRPLADLSQARLICDIFRAMGDYLRKSEIEFHVEGKPQELMFSTTLKLTNTEKLHPNFRIAKAIKTAAADHAGWEIRLEGHKMLANLLKDLNDDESLEKVFGKELMKRIEASSELSSEAGEHVKEKMELRRKFINELITFWRFVDVAGDVRDLSEKYIQPSSEEMKFLDGYNVAQLEY